MHFSLHAAGGGRGNLVPPSQAAAGGHCLYLSFNCFVHGEEEKTHLKLANSGTRIKAGKESYFAIAVSVISPVQTKLWPAGCLAVVAVLECQFINELLV